MSDTFDADVLRTLIAGRASGDTFTANDITTEVREAAQLRPNQIGRAFQTLASEGLIRKTGRIVEGRHAAARGHVIREWVVV